MTIDTIKNILIISEFIEYEKYCLLSISTEKIKANTGLFVSLFSFFGNLFIIFCSNSMSDILWSVKLPISIFLIYLAKGIYSGLLLGKQMKPNVAFLFFTSLSLNLNFISNFS